MDELTELLCEAKAGSKVALERFVRRSQPEVWRFCAHLVGASAADDATQETYVAVWRGLTSFRRESSARTWLLVIARRTALRLAGKQVRQLEVDRHIIGPPEAPHPERSTDLGDQLSQLSEDRRLALVLTQVLGLSYAEAAAVCGCAVGTIRSRVARGREDLLALRAASEREVEPIGSLADRRRGLVRHGPTCESTVASRSAERRFNASVSA